MRMKETGQGNVERMMWLERDRWWISVEHGNEHSVCFKCGEFVELSRACQSFSVDPAAWVQ